MTRQEAAKKLGVTPSLVSRWILRGWLKATRHGMRSWIISDADLRRFKPRPIGRPKKKVA